MTIKNDEASELLGSVRRIEDLLTIIARQALRRTMSDELRDPDALAVYAMTGSHTVREISTASGMALGTISKLWVRWESLGLVQKDGQRYRRTFDVLSGKPATSGARKRSKRGEQAVVTDTFDDAQPALDLEGSVGSERETRDVETAELNDV